MSMRQWQVQDVKARFDEVLKIAQHEGHQEVTSDDRSFVEFMARSPRCGADDLSFDRDWCLTDTSR